MGSVKDLVNQHKPRYYEAQFDNSKAAALFNNAKQLPEKRKELLAEALEADPTFADPIKYIFVNYPDERKTISHFANDFGTDLSPMYEETIRQAYTEEAKVSEEAALKARAVILDLMHEFGITKSKTLDQLENDCLTRNIEDVDTANEAICNHMKDRIQEFEAQDRIK